MFGENHRRWTGGSMRLRAGVRNRQNFTDSTIDSDSSQNSRLRLTPALVSLPAFNEVLLIIYGMEIKDVPHFKIVLSQKFLSQTSFCHIISKHILRRFLWDRSGISTLHYQPLQYVLEKTAFS